MDVEVCSECKKPYHVHEVELRMPGTKDKEPIICPHCGDTYEKISNGFFKTSKLNEKQMEEYNKNNE